MRAEEYFATEWPTEVPRLRRLLGRNGISLDQIDDVLQEAAIRLYTAWGRVFEDRPLRPLVNTIVLNAARDHHRRTHYEVRPFADIPDAAAVDHRGAEQAAIARLELARTGRALSALTEQQRRVVVSAVSDELAGEELGRVRAPAAQRMAITRARRRLVEVLEITAAAIGVGCAATRRVATRRGVRPGLALAAMAVTALALNNIGGDSPAAADGTKASEQSQTATETSAARSGVSQWQYDSSGLSLPPVTTSDPATGTSSWTWSQGSLVAADLFGGQVRVGQSSYDPNCTLKLVEHAVVHYHCLPIAVPTSATPQR